MMVTSYSNSNPNPAISSLAKYGRGKLKSNDFFPLQEQLVYIWHKTCK